MQHLLEIMNTKNKRPPAFRDFDSKFPSFYTHVYLKIMVTSEVNNTCTFS